MGLAVATSCLLGAFINFAVLAPIVIQMGDIAPKIGADGVARFSRAEIVNQWSLWWGVTMMVVGAMVSLLAKPEIVTSLFKRKAATAQGVDVLAHIEVPLWISYVGVPIVSLLGAYVTHLFFGVPMWLSVAMQYHQPE